VVPKITVVKLERKDAFDKQRYKVFIGDKEIHNVRGVKAHLTADEIPMMRVDIQFVTSDFQWINEEDLVEPLADGSTGG
jgi:hypothetical protein